MPRSWAHDVSIDKAGKPSAVRSAFSPTKTSFASFVLKLSPTLTLAYSSFKVVAIFEGSGALTSMPPLFTLLMITGSLFFVESKMPLSLYVRVITVWYVVIQPPDVSVVISVSVWIYVAVAALRYGSGSITIARNLNLLILRRFSCGGIVRCICCLWLHDRRRRRIVPLDDRLFAVNLYKESGVYRKKHQCF